MADVFGRQELSFGGAFAADSAVVTFAGSGQCLGTNADLAAGAGMLAQQLSFQYSQPVQRFFELGSQFVYYFAGRPSGGGSIGRLLGPRVISELFYSVLGNVCCADGNNIGIFALAGCTGGKATGKGFIIWLLKGVILNSLGSMVAAEDMIWREQLTFLFYCLNNIVIDVRGLVNAGSTAVNNFLGSLTNINGGATVTPGAGAGDTQPPAGPIGPGFGGGSGP